MKIEINTPIMMIVIMKLSIRNVMEKMMIENTIDREDDDRDDDRE